MPLFSTAGESSIYSSPCVSSYPFCIWQSFQSVCVCVLLLWNIILIEMWTVSMLRRQIILRNATCSISTNTSFVFVFYSFLVSSTFTHSSLPHPSIHPHVFLTISLLPTSKTSICPNPAAQTPPSCGSWARWKPFGTWCATATSGWSSRSCWPCCCSSCWASSSTACRATLSRSCWGPKSLLAGKGGGGGQTSQKRMGETQVW